MGRGAVALRDARLRALHLIRWTAIALPVGVVAGLLSASFLWSLDRATEWRGAREWTVWLLPLAGLVVGWTYHRLGRGLERGSSLVIERMHDHASPIPFRLVPLIFGTSVVSHLAGASVGREGAALQLAAGAADPLGRGLRFGVADRSLLVVAAVAAGFGSVFGAPIAGAVFALEVQRAGRVRYEALVPAFCASIVGDATVRGLGIEHTGWPVLVPADWSAGLVLRVAVLGLVAGLVALTFTAIVHAVRDVLARFVSWYPARPLSAGVLLAFVILATDWRDYQGLSIPLAVEAMNGSTAGMWHVKFALSALSIGAGFTGGEVIPLVVVGALLGAVVGSRIGIDPGLAAALGAVAVLAGAANTPLACTILGLELFGGNGVALLALACVAAYAASGRTGIYTAQRVSAPKDGYQSPKS